MKEEIEYIRTNCIVGPMEASFTTQLYEHRKRLADEIQRIDSAAAWLAKDNNESVLTETLQQIDESGGSIR